MYAKELKAAIRAAKSAGNEIIKFYGLKNKVKYKSDNSPVTEADLASNKIILNELIKFKYGILSEEQINNNERLKRKIVWIIDPLDGTKAFIKKINEFSVMIGLVKNNKPVLGVIYNPVKSIIYYAMKNQGAFVKKGNKAAKRIFVSLTDDPRKIKMLVSRFYLNGNETILAKALGVKKICTLGSSLKTCNIAEGKGEISFTTSPGQKEWDTCASDIILKEAGGKFTDTKGRDLKYNKKNIYNKFGYLATNGLIHKKALDALGKLRK